MKRTMTTTATTKRMTRRRPNLHLPVVAALSAVLCLGCLVVAGPVAKVEGASQKRVQKGGKDKRQPHALLFGTVFSEDGRLVRGARVTVKPKEGKGKWETGSDGQGEFAVHLPVGKAVYIVEVQAAGMEPGKKEVAFEGEERQDVVVQLKRP